MDNTTNTTEYQSTTKLYPNPFAKAPINPESYVKIMHSEVYTNFCGHCNMNFDDLIQFEHHNVTLHGSKKVLTCNICTATFRRQDHLKRHMHSLHKNQKYCLCPVCDKDCKRQDLLLKHIKRKHSSNTDVFKCRECTYHFNSLSELEKHENIHITDRHNCPQCNATFKRRDHMLRHIKSQHLNQVENCPLCNQVYKRKDHVARHVREKHKMGYINGRLVTSSDVMS